MSAFKMSGVIKVVKPTQVISEKFSKREFVVVEKWILEGTFMTDVNFGSLSYSQDALADISATLRMDRCILVY